MSSAVMKDKYSTLPVSKWDVRIQENKKRRNAEIRKHVFLLVLAMIFICIMILGINGMISEAGTATEDELSFKYYKNICLEQGDTLTSIARTYADREHYDSHDSYIREVVYMNHLKDADDVREGAYLIIPYYSSVLK